MLRKFYKPHGLTVKSHDFRTTSVTNYYKATQDPVKTQQFVGHAKLDTTTRYIKIGREEQDRTTKDFLTQ